MQIHRCRFVDYVPQAINAIEFTPETSKRQYIAVGRANGDIELWGVKGKLVYDKMIPNVVKGSVETLAWSHQTELTADDLELFDTNVEREAAKKRLVERAPRLFTAGLNAVIIEWDLAKLVPKAIIDSNGGAVWCMATNHAQTKLAVGTEDGHIRIFDITDDKLMYQRCFDKINSRILSVAWSHDDSTIVTGSADSSVRIWTASTGHVVARMTLPKEGRDPTLVWAVTVLKDDTIVSGDSRGHVVFWDPIMHVSLQDFRAQGADVLCLTADKAGHTVFASGVDPKITQFKLFIGSSPAEAISTKKKSLPNKTRKWQLSGFRRYHTHDVRALAVSSNAKHNLLISGGADTQVASCESDSFPNDNPHRQPCFPPVDSIISVAPKSKLVLQHEGCTLKIWELGKSEPMPPHMNDTMETGQALQVYERQRDLLRMDLNTKTNILSSTISPSGALIAASDSTGPKLYSVTRTGDSGEHVRVRRVKEFPPPNFVPDYSDHRGVTQMRFTSDESRIIMSTTDGFVSIVDISQWQSGVFETVRRHCGHRSTKDETETDAGCDNVPTHPAQARKMTPADVELRTITNMAVSADGKFVATSDSNATIIVSSVTGAHSSVLPSMQKGKVDSLPTAMIFDLKGNLVITTASNLIFVWDVSKSCFTKWTKEHSATDIPRTFENFGDCVSGIVTNPTEVNIVYAWAAGHITRIDLSIPPGPKRAVLNIHKRKDIEKDILTRFLDEKQAADKRSARHIIKRKKKEEESVDGSVNGSARMDIVVESKDARAEDSVVEVDWTKSKDWASTYAARLREAGINVNVPHNFRMTQRYQHLMHVSFIDNDTMVVIERPWIDVASVLPLAYHRHKYGA
ncbi:WD40-repeat-containing domain protein [Kickxella alabastrina]|uniref:WD40-repeat-containing domain protein n=1 Tax=Kickxella alabastrina TaxID=61397 RepID=UPI00221ED0B6|nr:WD40-repeat-containing domain protein [Kickxella alabastrina]KAI7826470.1 WD40-repeat-containing domain protein [Kickxella alabastrina]